MVDVAVTQEPADLQELLYAKSKPVLANMLAPELKTGVAKNYKVIDVERARGFSLVTVQLTRDPEKDIATATPEEIRTQVIEYEHHNLQDVLEHFLGKGEITVAKAITKLDDVNELIIERTDKILLDAADINFQDNGNNNISLFVKNQMDLRWWGAAHLSFNLVEGGEPEVPGKPLVKNVKYSVENNTVTADVTNASEVEITTSTGLSFKAQTNMDKVTYQFDEDLPAGTTITVTAGVSKGNVNVPGITELTFDRATGRVVGLVTEDVNANVHVVTANEELILTPSSDRSFFGFLTNYDLDSFTITASVVGGKANKLVVAEVPTTLTDLEYNAVNNVLTGKTNRKAVKVVTDTGVAQTVTVTNGAFEYYFPNQLPAGTVITVTAGPVSKDVIATAKPIVPSITDVEYDTVGNTVSGKSNMTSVYVGTTTGEGSTVAVVNGAFYHTFNELLPAGTVITVRADEVLAEITVAAFLENVEYYPRDNVVYGQTNALVVTLTASTGHVNEIASSNGSFDYTFPERLVEGDTVTVVAGTETVVLTIPAYELGNPITDIEFDPLLNSVSGKTTADTVTIRLSNGGVYRDVAVLDGSFNFVFPTRLENGLQIEISEAKGETANGYTNGIAEVSNIRYDHRTNQVLADLLYSDKITLVGNFNAAELTAVNNKVGHIPDHVLQGNDKIQFKQGQWVQAEYSIKPLNLVYGDDDTALADAAFTTSNGFISHQLNVNIDRLRYNYGTSTWAISGSELATIDEDGLLTINNVPNDGSVLNLTVTNTADGHITTAAITVQYGGAA